MQFTLIKIFFLGLIFFVSALAQSPHTITVQGNSKTQVTPNQAIISFDIKKNSSDANKAWAKMVNQTGIVKSKLQLQSIKEKDISIDYLELQEMYRSFYNESTKLYESIMDGYEARTQISVKVRDVNQVGALLNEIVSVGVKKVNQLSFTISDEIQSKLEKQLLKEAVENAKQKAKLVLGVLNQKIISVISVNLNEYNNYRPSTPVYKMAMMETDSAGGNVFNAGDQEKSMSLSVTFEIANDEDSIE